MQTGSEINWILKNPFVVDTFLIQWTLDLRNTCTIMPTICIFPPTFRGFNVFSTSRSLFRNERQKFMVMIAQIWYFNFWSISNFYTATPNRVTGGRAGNPVMKAELSCLHYRIFPVTRKTVIIAGKTCFHHIISLTPPVLPFWVLQQCRTLPCWNTKICHDSSTNNAVFTDQSCTSPEF